MSTEIELTGNVENVGNKVILTFPKGRGAISVNADDCKITKTGISVQIGTKIALKDMPPCDDKADLDRYVELMADAQTSYACVGAQPWLNLPGAFIDCATGKILGKCYQSFPCTSMK